MRSLFCVNLPRWGLKRGLGIAATAVPPCVNLPRWGLKHNVFFELNLGLGCKFTPLGFETSYIPKVSNDIISVNLPRWGLKRVICVALCFD